MTIAFIRGSGLPVSSKTLSTIDSQIPSKSTLNATAEHSEKIEANHPVVFDCTNLRLTGTAGVPPGLSGDASLDLRGREAAGLWHTARRRAAKLAVGLPRQFAMTRWPFELHIGSFLGGFATPVGQCFLPRYQSGNSDWCHCWFRLTDGFLVERL